jgi:hypothetical protein
MAARDCLKKSLLSLLVAGLVIASINISGAQFLSAIPGCGNVDLGCVKVVPFAQVGYKNIGFNLNLPFTITPVDQFGGVFFVPPAQDLQFRDARVWVGSIGFDTLLPANLIFALRADANASKNINVFTGETFTWWGRPNPYNWTGTQLQWWNIDGMVGYIFYREWSVVAGVRYDHLTVGLADPVDATGTQVGGGAGTTTNLRQDIIVKTWIPYIGLQLNDTNYRATLIYSPFASPQVTSPQSIAVTFPGGYASDLFNYKFTNTGSFLDGYFEYNVPVVEALQFGLWAKGTWMRISGDGSWNFVESAVPPPSSVVDPQSTTGTMSSYGLGGGVSASLSF